MSDAPAPGGSQPSADEPGLPDFQASADEVLGQLTEALAPEEAALALAVLVNRAVARLHNVARTQAAARKAQPDWPTWAQLQNASRTMVLHASTCRDLAARLAGRRQ
jgi:hypothetical protein